MSCFRIFKAVYLKKKVNNIYLLIRICYKENRIQKIVNVIRSYQNHIVIYNTVAQYVKFKKRKVNKIVS